MINKKLIEKIDYEGLSSAEMREFIAEAQAAFRRIERLEAIKAFKLESVKLRADIARMHAERK